MKYTFLIIFMIIFSCLKAQTKDSTEIYRQAKTERLVKQGNNQKIAGLTLVISGSLLITGGFIYGLGHMFSGKDENTGAVMIITGAGLAVAGIVFLSSSSVKLGKARALLKTGQIKMKIDSRNYMTQSAIGIAFRF